LPKKVLKFFKSQKPPRDYFQYVWLLLGSLILFSVLSFTQTKIVIGNYELKDSGIRNFFLPEVLPLANIADTIKKTGGNDKVDSSAQKFLLIGDSMLEFLRVRLNDYCRKNNHTMNTVIWYSSSSLWYGQCDTLKYFINKHKPTYVLLVLGANELFVKNITTERAEYVRNIVAQMDPLPFVWIGPPNWKDDTGINDLILRYAGKDRYYPSKKLSFERTKDGAHPKRESAYNWMDSVAVYLQTEARYKILMAKPDTFLNKVPPTEILKPNPPF
jgi:hypothetical protein